MRQAPAQITVDDWLARMARLALRHGVHLSSLQRKGGQDLELVLASASLHLPVDTSVDEGQANDAIRAFLLGSGAMLAIDHVELRRWMVDTGYLRRSAAGTDYRRGTLPEWLAPAAAQLDARRIEQAVLAAREAHRQQRAERHRAWQASRPGGSQPEANQPHQPARGEPARGQPVR